MSSTGSMPAAYPDSDAETLYTKAPKPEYFHMSFDGEIDLTKDTNLVSAWIMKLDKLTNEQGKNTATMTKFSKDVVACGKMWKEGKDKAIQTGLLSLPEDTTEVTAPTEGGTESQADFTERVLTYSESSLKEGVLVAGRYREHGRKRRAPDLGKESL